MEEGILDRETVKSRVQGSAVCEQRYLVAHSLWGHGVLGDGQQGMKC